MEHLAWEGALKMRQCAKCIAFNIKTELQNRAEFYRNTRSEAAGSNMKLLITANIAAIFLLILFLLLTPYIIPGWIPTAWHIAFLPTLLVSLSLILLYAARRSYAYGVVTSLCVLLDIILLTFSILLDTVGSPHGPGTFLAIMLIVIPSLFTVPLLLSYALTVTAELVYVAFTLICKDNMIGRYDIFSSIVAFSFSLVVANIITILNVRNYMLQKKYKSRSMTDGLTHILNKEASFERLEKYFLLSNPETTCTFIIMDLDNFKKLNDTKGHAFGDQILRQVGMLLLGTFRHVDVVGRFGGDEFIVLMEDVASEQIAEEKCRMIQEGLRRMSAKEGGVEVTASFGIVLASRQQVVLERIFLRADEALYEAKRKGKFTYVTRPYA